MSEQRPRRRRRDPANPTPAQRARARSRQRTDLSPPTARRSSQGSVRKLRRRALATQEAAPRRVAVRRGISLPSVSWARSLARVAVLVAEVAIAGLVVNNLNVDAAGVTVTGVHHLTRQQLLAATGLDQPESIFLVIPDRAEEAIRRNPYVRSVSVRAHLPGAVDIEVVEWQPLAVLTSGQAHFLINGAGAVLGVVSDETVGTGADQPRFVVAMDAPRSVEPGHGAISGLLLGDLDQVLAVVQASGLTIRRFNLSAQLQLTAETAEGPRILFGQMATDEQIHSLDAKLTALKTLAARVDLAHSKVPYINLENATAPALGPVPSPSPRPVPSPRPSPSPSR